MLANEGEFILFFIFLLDEGIDLLRRLWWCHGSGAINISQCKSFPPTFHSRRPSLTLNRSVSLHMPHNLVSRSLCALCCVAFVRSWWGCWNNSEDTSGKRTNEWASTEEKNQIRFIWLLWHAFFFSFSCTQYFILGLSYAKRHPFSFFFFSYFRRMFDTYNTAEYLKIVPYPPDRWALMQLGNDAYTRRYSIIDRWKVNGNLTKKRRRWIGLLHSTGNHKMHISYS